MPIPNDTRDRLIALEVEVKHLIQMVEKNSGILADLHEAHQKAQGGFAAASWALSAGKMLGSGGAGAALLAALQIWVKA